MLPQGSAWIEHRGRHKYDGYFQLVEQATSVTGLTPSSNSLHIYAKDNSGTTELYYKNSAGVERDLSLVAGSLVTGTGAANRLAYWTAAQTIDDLSALTQGRVMFPDSNGLPTGSTSLFWNNTNSDLTVGSADVPSVLSFFAGRGLFNAKVSSLNAECHLYTAGITGVASVFRGTVARGTIASPTATQTNDGTGLLLNVCEANGAIEPTATARILLLAAENQSTTAQGSCITFETTPTGSAAASARAERMRILQDGDLIIGYTSVPFASLAGRGLTVVRSGTIAENCTYTFGVAGTTSQNRLVTARGTPGSPSATQADDRVAWSLVGYGENAFTGGRARIEAGASQNWTNANQGAYLSFFTTPDGSTSTVERARFLQSGHLRLEEFTSDPGTAVLSSLAQMCIYMKSNKFVIAYNNGGTVTYVSIPLDGSTTTWTHNTTAP